METEKNEGALREPERKEDLPTSSKGGPGEGAPAEKGRPARVQRAANNTRRLRLERMMSKAELARRAGVSTLTIDRVERGMNCRMDTKRKIIEALGLRPEDRTLVFAEDE
jgi:DNA-binding XRE family transcriptional regulator